MEGSERREKSEKGGQNWNRMENEVKVFFKMKETQGFV